MLYGKNSTSPPLYNLFVRLYVFGIRLAGFFMPKARKWVDGRKGWKNRVAEIGEECTGAIWVHCASLGEYEMARPLIDKILDRDPNEKVVLSFFSPSGFEHARLRDEVKKFYLPPDTITNAKYCIDHLDPRVLIFVKYDLWFNLIGLAHRQNIPLYIFNYHPSPSTLNHPLYGGMLMRSLRKFIKIYTLNQRGYELLSNKQGLNLEVGGDSRFNNVLQRAKRDKDDEKLDLFSRNFDRVFVCGSIWKADWEVIKDAVEGNSNIGWIVAPHEIEPKKIEKTMGGSRKVNFLYYTSDNVEKGNEEKNVLILDCIGKLAAAYRYGFAAYVGGGFGSGLHNILEPAAYGVPVAFGPKHRRFPEAVHFVENNIGQDVRNSEDFQKFVSDALAGEKYLSGKAVVDQLKKWAGRSEKMLEQLTDYIDDRKIKAN